MHSATNGAREWTKKRRCGTAIGLLACSTLFALLAPFQAAEAAYDLSLVLPSTYSTFLAAANAVDITPYTIPALYTIFAPLNSAFERLGCLTDFTANKTLTAAIVKYHMVNYPHDYARCIELATSRNPWVPRTFFNNYQLQVFFQVDKSLIFINNQSWIVAPEVTNDGTLSVHGIDTVLIPPNVKMPSNCKYY
ncbi:hypothetical protein KP509_30G043400 [Ceratopteris richardii]|uniref:FAS1 domain-containing protein n=1 Tax=Ceratopteris richardii TaxID=49495 RepID=A0A8T2R2Y7_CERRI|nr:hypothetical protein KP509_30G043400 [Ceratopteris richardii]